MDKSFTIVNKYFINTYVQFLLTKHTCDERVCIIVPCIGAKTGNIGIFERKTLNTFEKKCIVTGYKLYL